MKQNVVKEKSFAFASRIVDFNKYLTKKHKEYVLSKQVLESGTSIGALIREAEHAESKADFIHKMSISLKEANETEYWIDLIYHGAYVNEKEYNSLKEDLTEILKLIIAIIKSAKNNN
jgi:four helix bundle protein